jgi:hypothetical protein
LPRYQPVMLERSVDRGMLLKLLEGIRGPTESVGHGECMERKRKKVLCRERQMYL